MNNNVTSSFVFHIDSEAIRDASIVLIISVIGIFCNVVSAIVLTRNRVFKNSFGQLTTLHAVANTGVLLIFAIWAVPLMIIELPDYLFWLNLRIGQLSLFFVEIAFHACLFISINRFCAIATPSFYRRYFNRRLTMAIIVFCCFLSGMYWTAYFIDGCYFFFNTEFRLWYFADTSCGSFMAQYIDLTYNVSLFCVVGALDLATICLLRGANKRLRTSTEENSRRTRREVRFFLQAVTNTLVYAFMLVCFHVIINWATTDFTVFLSSTVIWGFSHACGGVILVMFNKEIGRLFTSPGDFFRLIADTRSMSTMPATTVTNRKAPGTVTTIN